MKKHLLLIFSLLTASISVCMQKPTYNQTFTQTIAQLMNTKNYSEVVQVVNMLSELAEAVELNGHERHRAGYLQDIRTIAGAFLLRAAAEKTNTRFIAAFSAITTRFAQYAQKFQGGSNHQELFSQLLALKKMHLSMIELPSEAIRALEGEAKGQYAENITALKCDIVQTMYVLNKYKAIRAEWENSEAFYRAMTEKYPQVSYIIGASYFKTGGFKEALPHLQNAYKAAEQFWPMIAQLVSGVTEKDKLLEIIHICSCQTDLDFPDKVKWLKEVCDQIQRLFPGDDTIRKHVEGVIRSLSMHYRKYLKSAQTGKVVRKENIEFPTVH